jgi:AcrR family transcriptional regulator
VNRHLPAQAAEVGSAPHDARERLVLTAYDLFRRHGLHTVGVDRIVNEAGVAKTTLYRHFPSKDDLVVAVLQHHEQVWARGWLEPETARRAESPELRILAIFDVFDDWFHEESFQGCLFVTSLLETFETNNESSSIRAEAVSALEHIYELVRQLSEEAGVFDAAFPCQIHLLMQGSIIAAARGRLDAAQYARAVAQLLLEQAKAGQASASGKRLTAPSLGQ